jgi:hypothetical protein
MDKMPPKTCEFGDCKKKINITVPKCACNKFFCDNHRFFNDHKCTYNKKDEKKELIKVVADKIIKI